jgi:hypothetical protein
VLSARTKHWHSVSQGANGYRGFTDLTHQHYLLDLATGLPLAVACKRFIYDRHLSPYRDARIVLDTQAAFVEPSPWRRSKSASRPDISAQKRATPMVSTRTERRL